MAKVTEVTPEFAVEMIKGGMARAGWDTKKVIDLLYSEGASITLKEWSPHLAELKRRAGQPPVPH